MVNLRIVKTFIKIIPPKKFEKFFSQKCTINSVCFNSDVFDTFFIKISFFSQHISTVLNMQYRGQAYAVLQIFFKNIFLAKSYFKVHAIIEVLLPSQNLGT